MRGTQTMATVSPPSAPTVGHPGWMSRINHLLHSTSPAQILSKMQQRSAESFYPLSWLDQCWTVFQSLRDRSVCILLTSLQIIISTFSGCQSCKSWPFVQLLSFLRGSSWSTNCASPCLSDHLSQQVLG